MIASPYAKKIAAERNVDLSLLVGSGPSGRIVASDVLSFEGGGAAASSPAVAAAGVSSGDGFSETTLSGEALALAAKLSSAKQTVPHYFLTVDVDMTEALKLRASLNARSEEARVSVNDVLVRASALAMRDVPEVNSEWRAEGVVRSYERVDVNVFMNSELSSGTVAPCVVDAGAKGFLEISEDLQRAQSAVETTGGVPVSMSGNGTFSIVNLGAFGVKAAAPIINTPQACILAVGAIENRVVPKDGGYETRPHMSATISCDHRVVDGAVGAQWLASFKHLLQDPTAMLI